MRSLLPLSMALLSASAMADTTTGEQGWIDQLLAELGASETVDTSKLIDWGVLPGPFVNPEQGFGIGVAAIGLYTPTGWQQNNPLSTLKLTSYASTSGSFGLGVENRTYLAGDSLRLLANAGISFSPSYYWGIGKQAAENEQAKTAYDAQILRFEPKLAVEIFPNGYLIGGWSYQQLSSIDADPGAFTEADQADSQASGLLIGLEYDSRDFEPNPASGHLLTLEWIGYDKTLGSDHDYQRLTANARTYWQLDSQSLLAIDAFGQFLDGDIPWYGYSEIGNASRMRGYYEGQYRDRTQLAAQIEWRRQLSGRHGMVAWAGAGNIAPSASKLFSDSWLPTVGVGYRFAFKARVNIRVDLGVGKDSTGFYFQVNEAF